MKHWQYTEASNTCKICGYETHSLPTFRRHVKYCSSSEPGSTSATSLPKSTTVSLKAKSFLDDKKFVGLQMHSSENDAKAGGLSTTGESNTLKNGEEDMKLQVNETLKADSFAEVPPRIFMTDEESNATVTKSAEKDGDVSGSNCRQWKTSSKTTNRALLDEKNMPAAKKKVLKTSCEDKQVTDGPVNFVCTFCNVICTDERAFQSHLESCTNKARKFSCSECEFACDDDAVWAKHRVEKHFSGTVHSCSECLYKTVLKKNFDRHRACHRVNAAFKCDFCSYSSTGESAVRRHISSYHSVEESKTLEGSKESDPKFSSKSRQQRKKKSSRCIQQSPAESESSDDLIKHIDSSENIVDGDETANEESDAGEVLLGEAGAIESQDVDLEGKLEGDIVWSCFWCKLDFKNRQEMDTHTKLEHSIELKDCMLYSLDKDDTSETLFELEQEQLPEMLNATLTSATNEKIHKCEICEYRGRRVSDLRQHFTRKHIQNSSGPNQKTCKRPSKEELPSGRKSKKAKISKTASDESSTILAKLLQNDDPNSVYNPSKIINSSNGEKSIGKSQKNKTNKLALQSSNKNMHRSELESEHDNDDNDDDDDDTDDTKAAANRNQTVTKKIGRGGNLRKQQRNYMKVLNSNQNSDKKVEYFMSLMCNYCGYLGDSPAEVERHTHTHTGIKTHWCPLCEYKTIWKCDMKRHLTKSHQSESSTPACLAKLLHMAYRPDGKHTAEELDRISPRPDGKGVKKGSPESSSKTKFKWMKMKVTKSPTQSGHVKDLISSIIPSKKLLKKAKQKLLIQQISHLVRKDFEQDSTLPLTVASVKQEEAQAADGLQNDNKISWSDETVLSVSDESALKRCRPFKCSECGKRSNWKWDIKKHIAEHHPGATLITLNKEEAQKSFAEIVRIHHEKQLQSGQMLQLRRIRLGTTYEQNEDVESEDHQLPCSSATSCVAEDGDEVETLTRPAESSLHGCRNIHKGMVDLDKLKRFKCSSCIYRSSFRGDISRHIRSKHAGAKCSVIIMAADNAAASLDEYNCEWKMRRLNPAADDDGSANSDKRPMDDLTPKVEEIAMNHDNLSEENNGNGKINQQTKATDNQGGSRVSTGVKRKYGGDAEDSENLKRRIRSQAENEMKCCNICPYTTEKSDLLKLHMSYHQPQARNGYSCTYCPYFVNTERLLDHHLLLHASKEPVCRSINSYLPKASISNKVSRTKYICDKCPFTSNQRDLYLQHRSKHFEKSSAVGKCSYCSYWAPDKRDLSQHHKLHVKFYFPRTLEHPTKSRDDQISCRCVFAERKNDARFRCGCELQCLYCTFTIESVMLIRQHIVSCHMGFTDAVRNELFDRTLDDADDYLFIPCKYQPSKMENSRIALQSECSKLLTSNHANIIEENEKVAGEKILTGRPAMAISCMVLGADEGSETMFKFGLVSDEGLMSAKSDDVLSVETTDMDLPELEMFSCGNSDISDKTSSPDFVEAELMEVELASSKLRLCKITSEVERQGNFEAFSLDETPAVVETSSVVETPSVAETTSVVEAPSIVETPSVVENLSVVEPGVTDDFVILQSGKAAPVLELPLDKDLESGDSPETLLVKELSLDEIDFMKFTKIRTSLIVDMPVLGKTEPLELPVGEMISAQSVPTIETSSQGLVLKKTMSLSEVPLNKTESSTSNALHSAQASCSSSLPKTMAVYQKTNISDDYISIAETPTNSDEFLKLLRSLGLKPRSASLGTLSLDLHLNSSACI